MSQAALTHVGVPLPAGIVDVPVFATEAVSAWAVLVLAHGAGAGAQHPFLSGLADAMADVGVTTVRFDFPYRVAGRRLPGPAAHAISTWEAVVSHVSATRDGPVFAAGKSYGGRMASLAAADGRISPRGLVYLGYPLHAPGKPEKLRAAHLSRITVPQLFVEGTRDPFVDPHEQLEDAVAGCVDARVAWVEGADHSFAVRGRSRDAREIGAGLASIATPFLRALS